MGVFGRTFQKCLKLFLGKAFKRWDSKTARAPRVEQLSAICFAFEADRAPRKLNIRALSIPIPFLATLSAPPLKRSIEERSD